MKHKSMRLFFVIILLSLTLSAPGAGAQTPALPPEPPAISYTAQDVPALLERAGIAPENILPGNASAAEGDYQWHTFYGGTVDEHGLAIVVDNSGNVYVVGNSNASWNGPTGQLPLHAHGGGFEVFVLKLSSTGTYQWHTFHGSTYGDSGYATAVDNSGNVYVTGNSNASWDGPAGQSPLHTYSSGSYEGDVFVLKLSPTGTYQWHTFYGSTYGDSGYATAVDNSGNAYVTGNSNASWDGPAGQSPLHAYNGLDDIFVLKLSPTGTYQWHTFYGSTHYDNSNGIAFDSSDNVYVTGWSQASWNGPTGQIPLHAHSSEGDGETDVFVLKLSSTGMYQWHTFYGRTDSDTGYAIAVDSSDNVYITGYSWALWNGPIGQMPLHEHSSNGDVFVLKLSSAGAYRWHTFYGGTHVDEGLAVAVDSSNNVYITGRSWASWNGPTGQTPFHMYSGGADAFVLKLSSAGAYQWHTFYGSTDYNGGSAIAVDSSDNVYVTGWSATSWNGPTGQMPLHTYSGGVDAFILKHGVAPADISIVSVEPVQSVTGVDLVAGKATAVKVVVQSDGANAVYNIPVKVTHNGQEISKYYVALPDNLDVGFRLIGDNNAFPLSFSNVPSTTTVYFFDSKLAPNSTGTYVVSAAVEYPGDTNPTNNTATSEMYAVRQVDLSGSGGNVVLAYMDVDDGDAKLYRGYQGTQYFAKMYPTAENRVQDMHLGEFNSELPIGWFDIFNYAMFRKDLFDAMQLAAPNATRYIGVVPAGWFAINHPLGFLSVGGEYWPTQPKMVLVEQSTEPDALMHELGHSYGLWPWYIPLGEEYIWYPNGILVYDGVDVPNKGLMQTGVVNEAGGIASIYSMMGKLHPGSPWIRPEDYTQILDSYNLSSLSVNTVSTSERLLVSGIVSETSDVTIGNWWRLPVGEADVPETGDWAINVYDSGGSLLYTHSFSPTFITEGGLPMSAQAFSLVIPYPLGATDIHISEQGMSHASRHITPNPPQVSVISPNGGEAYATQDTIPVSWSDSDADGDALTYAVLYSSDDGASWVTLDIGLTSPTYQVPAASLEAGSRNRIKVIATDGVNTGQDVSNASFTIRTFIYLPVIIKSYR